MSTPQTTTVKLKFQADAAGLSKGLKEVAQATAGASKAEREYQQTLKKREQARTYGAHRGEPAGGGWRGQEAVGTYGLRDDRPPGSAGGWRGREGVGSYGMQTAVNRVRDVGPPIGGYSGSHAMGRGPEPTAVAEAKRRIAAVEHEREVHARMKSMGWEADGSGSYKQSEAKPPKSPESLADVFNRIPLKRAGVIGALYSGAQTASRLGDVQTEAFTTSYQRGKRFFTGLPGGETAARLSETVMDHFKYGLGTVRTQREEGARTVARAEEGILRREAEANMAPEIAERRASAALTGGFRAARIPAHLDRSTDRGELAYKEESRLLGLRDRAAKASIAENVARAKSVEIAKQQARVEAEIEDLAQQQAKSLKDARKWEKEENNPMTGEATSAGQNARLQLNAAHPLRQSLDEQQVRAKEEVARAAHESRQSQAELSRGKLANLEAREERGASHAESLSYLGQGGRLTGAMALQTLRQIGIEQAPPDLIAAAKSVAPEEVRKMAQGAGTGFAQAFTGITDDSRNADAANLPGIRKQVDQERETATAMGEQSDATLANDMAESIGGALARKLKMISEMVAAKINSMELEGFARWSEAGR